MPRLHALCRMAPLAMVAALACAGPDDPGLEPAFVKPSADPTVTSTDPDTAVQDTTLDVSISGSGFDNGTVAEWLLAGVADPRVSTNSTRYVSARTLVANITIASDAVPAAYDVAVTTSKGKKGIGTERFVVQLRDPSANFEFTDAGMGVTSDGRGPYVGNTCGVGGRIYIANGGGDAVLNPYQTSPTTSALCGGVARVLNVDLGGTLGIRAVLGTNVGDVDHLAFPNSRLQDFGFGLMNSNGCDRVNYRAAIGGQIKVTATGFDALGRRTWLAESQAPHTAGCFKPKKGVMTWDGVQRVIPFRMTITEDYSH